MTSFEIERRALARRLFDDGAAALELLGVYAGDRLGLYATLARHEHVTAAQLAADTGVDGDFVRQWLEQQVSAGFIAASRDRAGVATHRLPGPHRPLLAGAERWALWTPVALVAAGIVRTAPHLVVASDEPSR